MKYWGRPAIRPEWRARAHEYLGGTIRGLGGVAEAVGGVEDQVHLLVSLKRTQAPADLTRELRKTSSLWVAKNFERGFSRQEGYSIFTASWTHAPALRRYIARQEAHHGALSSVGELKRLLERNGVKYDPQYLV